ncbi:MAG: hypothetical protein ACI8RD_003335 [Bacillariaceae sp.]|jgi:hypothetical protein
MTVDYSSTRGVLFSPDDRYDVWEVKRVERPHLIQLEIDQDNVSDNHDNESSTIVVDLPLIDGCDLKGWRHSKLIEISSCIQGYLNVGSGCSLIRKESQLPVALSSQSKMRWRTLQAKLLQPPKSTALRISEQDAIDLLYYPWFERENVPVILEGFTKSWKAMETCTFDRLVDDFGEYQWRFSDTHGATMSLNTYKKYVTSIEGQSDDAPLAVYDSQLHTDERACLLDDYTVPKCFNAPDLFESMMGDDNDDDDDDDDENNSID